MGWMIKRIGSNRETLKRSIREALEEDRGAQGNAHPARVASAVDAMVDIFPGFNGLTLEIITQGNLDTNGSGVASVTISTVSSDEMI
jgi:hypothetical protein